jgi:hypothetical protein
MTLRASIVTHELYRLKSKSHIKQFFNLRRQPLSKIFHITTTLPQDRHNKQFSKYCQPPT